MKNDASPMIADLHCDTAMKLLKGKGLDNAANHVSLAKLRTGRVGLQVFACWISPKFRRQAARQQALQLIAAVRDEVEKHPDDLMLVSDRASWRQCREQGKIGALLAIEGGHACVDDPAYLDEYDDLGVRILTLTWNNHNKFADSSAHALKRGSDGGLTDLGRELVRRAATLGMVIDLSHSSQRTFWDVLELAQGHAMVSHSCAMGLRRHHRNLTDEQIKALAKQGGLLGINFYPGFLGDQRDPADIQSVVDQFAYIKKLTGTGFLAMGSDFDGISKTPQELDGPDKFPALLQALRQAGFTGHEIEDVSHRNVLRFLGW